jgi:protein involved in polysaccharide export with SLBB domain
MIFKVKRAVNFPKPSRQKAGLHTWVAALLIFAAAFGGVRAQTNLAAAYQLNPMDRLSISIAEDPVKGQPIEVSVSPLGDLVVRVSRCCDDSVVVNVRGKTLGQVETELKEKLEADFYQKATLQMRLVDQTRRKGQVFLRGAVRANSVPIDPGKPLTLWEALNQAGTTEYANFRKVKVDRNGKITEYDIEAVNKGDRSKDVELQDGDRITVVEKRFNF